MSISRAALTLTLVLFTVAACGGGGVTPRGHRTASDCERLVRHTINAIAAENGAGAPTPDQAGEIDALVAERCGDAEYLAWVNDLPDASFACLLRATSTAQGDACMAALQAPEPAALPPPPAGPTCAAFTGVADGSATLIGVVTTAAGAPFVGATVVLSRDGVSTITEITDSKGGYVMLSIPAGTYQVTVYAGDQVVPKHCVDIAGGDATTTVDVTLP